MNKRYFLTGLRVGVPIGLGYFAVSFALGIAARAAGMSPLQSGAMSVLMLASAGQYAAITIIAAGGSLIEMILTTVVVNLRYLLMGAALSQKVEPSLPLPHRLFVAYGITDEIFGASMSLRGKLSPSFTAGALLAAVPGWSIGCFLGNLAGDILPPIISSSLGVALYGMFLAIIIPPARKSRVIAVVVIASMALSYIFSVAPVLSAISSGMQIIILTVAIASAAAIIRPVTTEED